jgi:hypothetical protein
MGFIFTGYYKNGGFSPKVPGMKFVNAASKQEKNKFRKRQEG